jgi:hypothetical protein
MQQMSDIRVKHEYLTFLVIKDVAEWKCGVVQNSNNRFITFYDLSKIREETDRKSFLRYADKWWWESGNTIPIDCFIGRPFDIFQESLTTIARKTLSLPPVGPVYSITEHYLKRVKKRKIDLISRKVA